MKKITHLIMSTLLYLLYSSLLHAEPNSVPQAYALSDSLQLQEKVPGINLIGGQITHSQALISGKLPYVMSYVGSVRNNLSASNDYFDQFLTTGGWTDNYQNSVRFYSYGGSATQGYYAIRLPGSRQDVWLRNINRSICSGGVQRAFSSDVIGNLAYGTGANIVWACSTNGYQFSEGVNGGIIIDYRGIKYATTVASITQSGTRYYRIASAIQPQGSKLMFSYDAQLNMLSVADNRNNKLDFSRDYKAGTIQTNLEKRLISKVELTSGVGAKQNATLTYDSYNSQDANGSNGSIYYPVITTSTMAGKSTFGYTPFKQWGIHGYLTSKGATITNTNAAILTSVKDAADAVRRQWLVTQNYSSYVASTKTYSTAKLTLQVRSPIGGGFANDYTVNYDDNARTVILTTKPNGVDIGTVTYTITPKPVTKTSDTGITYIDDGESEISVNGTFPALSIDGKMPKTVNVHSWYGYIKKAVMVNNLTLTQVLDGSARLVNTTYTAPSLPTQTTTYIYGKLSDNSDNDYAVPTKITTPYQTITNVVNIRGQITNQTQTSTQAGSVAQTIAYSYYTDPIQANYGLIESVTRSGTNNNGTLTANHKTLYGYDAWGNIATETHYRTNFSTNVQTALVTQSQEYNSAGQPKRIIYPDGTAQEYTYNGSFRKTQEKTGAWNGADFVGNIITNRWTYNDLNQLISSCDGDNVCIYYDAYDDLGRPYLVTEGGSGNYTTYQYYPNNSYLSIIKRKGTGEISSETYYTLDSNGRIKQERSGANPNRNFVNSVHDDNGNLKSTTTANGIMESWTYDALNRIETHTDGEGKITKQSYDSMNNLLSNMDPIGQIFSYTYRNGGVKASANHNSLVNTAYLTDALDNIKVANTATRFCDYPLYNEDNLPHVKDCKTENSPLKQVYELYHYHNQSGVLEVAEQYYPNGDTALQGKGAKTQYTYNSLKQLTSKTQLNKKLATQALINGYSYTNAGRLAAISYPGGKTVAYTYDNAGRVNGIYWNNIPIITNVKYDGSNRYQSWSWGWWENSKISEQFEYDAQTHLLNWIKHIDTTTGHIPMLGTCNFYDADARVTQRCDTFGNNYQITLDKTGRIKSNLKTNDNVIQGNYSYDANGNREVAWSDALPKYYDVYNYTGNKLTDLKRNEVTKPIGNLAEGIVYSNELIPAYDAAGRRLWDSKNGVIAWYHYNHLNQRIYKQVGSQAARQFAYDESGHLIGEYDLAGNAVNEYIYLEDKPIAVVRNGTLHYITADMSDTPRIIINSNNGMVVWAWSYDGAFGEVKPVNYQPENFEFNLRFPGQYYDEHSGLFYNHNRYYNPELGRYMEPDPIGLEGGLNPYAYAGNNPVNNVDPSGLSHSGGMVPMTDYQMSIGLNQSLNALNNMQLSFERASSNFINQPNYNNILAKDDSAMIGRIYASQGQNPVRIMNNRYQDMQRDNTIGNDKYFHCLAHCEASAVGGAGVAVSQIIGVGREITDMGRPKKWQVDWQGNFPDTLDYKWKDTKADMDANRTGREGGRAGQACYSVCSLYVVPGINKRYLKNGGN